jgi:hypothetical protein
MSLQERTPTVLSKDQELQLQEFCELQNLPPDQAADRLALILSEAESDPIFLQQLEITKFYGCLDQHQQSLVKEYFTLLNSPPDLINDDRICEIWSEAETNQTLCRWLSLVDDLCNDPFASIQEADNNRWAYLAEYMVLRLQIKLEQHKEENSWLTVKCHDGYIVSCKDLAMDDRCDHCGVPIREHSFERHPEALLTNH